MAKLTVIDYKTGGNIFSVKNSLDHLGIENLVSSNAAEIAKADKLLFPGVGSFSTAMQALEELGLKDIIKEKALSGTPFLGICVGMQVMFTQGTEGSDCKGLDIIPGKVDEFKKTENLKIPHMGWNKIKIDKANPLFKNIEQDSNFYFVHSYRVDYKIHQAEIEKRFPQSKISTCNYGTDFISSFWDGANLFTCQFHPEKSAVNGLRVLENFASL